MQAFAIAISKKLALKLAIIQQMKNQNQNSDSYPSDQQNSASQGKNTKYARLQGFYKAPEVLPLQNSIEPDRKDRSRSPSESSFYFNKDKKAEQGEQGEKKAKQGGLERQGNSAHQGTSLHQESYRELVEKKLDSYKQIQTFLMENVQFVPVDRRDSFLLSIRQNRTRRQGQIQQYKLKKQQFKVKMKMARLIDKILSTNESIQKKEKVIFCLQKEAQAPAKKYTKLTQDEKKQLAERFDQGQLASKLWKQYGISSRNCTNILNQFSDPQERSKNDPNKKRNKK